MLSIAGKVLAKIMLNRLKTISEQLLLETQCGFHASRSTTDMIFTLRQLQEKAMEQQRSLYIVFVDFSKASETVNRWTLWKVLKAYGCPESFINMIRQFHDGITDRVSIGGDISDAFPINQKVKWLCFGSYTFHSLPWGRAGNNVCEPSQWCLHPNMLRWKLFNLACLKVETRTNTLCVKERLYADDTVLVATDYNDIQEIVNQFHPATNMFGLKTPKKWN